MDGPRHVINSFEIAPDCTSAAVAFSDPSESQDVITETKHWVIDASQLENGRERLFDLYESISDLIDEAHKMRRIASRSRS